MKKILTTLLILSSSFALADLNEDFTKERLKREQRQEQERLQKEFTDRNEAFENLSFEEIKKENSNEVKFYISKINLSDDEKLLNIIEKERILEKYTNKELGSTDLTNLLAELTNRLIAKGYITSVASIEENTDLSTGVLDLKLIYGRIEKITLNDDSNLDKLKKFFLVNSKASSQSLNGEVNLITGEFNVGGGISKDKSSEKTRTNTQIYGENIAIKSEDLTVKGGNIEADKVNIEAKNLHIESMQDEAKSKHQAINISVGSSSVGGGIEYGKHEKEWVEKQSSIIGREKAEINVAEKTDIVGAVIGGADTTLKTKELEFTNIEDKEKGYNIGMSANANISSTAVFNEADPNNPNKKTNISKSESASYDAVDRKQINRATIGAGTIIVDGKEATPNINRDESKAQEITKDVSVDKVGIDYSDNTREWSVSSIQDILGEHVKEALVVPLNAIKEKFKLYEKYKIFDSKNTQYKIIRERTDTGKLIRYLPIKLSKDTILEKGSKAHTNGMQTDLESAVSEVEKHNIMKNYKDFDLENIKPGEKIEYILFQNETRGLIGDAYESVVDKFGVKGSNKVYSKAAIEQGEFIWKNRDRIDEMTLFSQGNIQYYAALHYIEEKYGVGALEKIKTSHYNSFGSPLNRVEFEGFLKSRGIKASITSKNDKGDHVAHWIGNNPHNVIRQEGYEDYILKKENRNKILWTDRHSQYRFGQKTSELEYGLHQKIFNIMDKGFNIFKIRNYLRKEVKDEY